MSESENSGGRSAAADVKRRRIMAWASVAGALFILQLLYPLAVTGYLWNALGSNGGFAFIWWFVLLLALVYFAKENGSAPIPFPIPWPIFFAATLTATFNARPHLLHSLPAVPYDYLIVPVTLAGLYRVIMGRRIYWVWIAFGILDFVAGWNVVYAPCALLIPLLVEPSGDNRIPQLPKPPIVLRLIGGAIIAADIGASFFIPRFPTGPTAPTYFAVAIALITSVHLQLLLTTGWWRWDLIKLRALAGLTLLLCAIGLLMWFKGGPFNPKLVFLVIGFVYAIAWPIDYPCLLFFPWYKKAIVWMGLSQRMARKMDDAWRVRPLRTNNPIRRGEG